MTLQGIAGPGFARIRSKSRLNASALVILPQYQETCSVEKQGRGRGDEPHSNLKMLKRAVMRGCHARVAVVLDAVDDGVWFCVGCLAILAHGPSSDVTYSYT